MKDKEKIKMLELRIELLGAQLELERLKSTESPWNTDTISVPMYPWYPTYPGYKED